AGDREVAVVGDRADVTRTQPPAAERLRGVVRSPKVARCQPGTAQPQLPAGAGSVLGRVDAPLEVRQGSTGGGVADGGRIVGAAAGRGCDLRHAVEVEDPHPDAVEALE